MIRRLLPLIFIPLLVNDFLDMNVSKRLQKGQLQTQIGTPYYMAPGSTKANACFVTKLKICLR